MLKRLTYETFCSLAGVFPSKTRVPQMLIAEYLRAEIVSQFKTDPISTQRLLGGIEPRLRSLGYSRNGVAESYFNEIAESGFSTTSVIQALVEIGDLVRTKGGNHFPSDVRFVQLDESLYLIASALPTSLLRRRVSVEIISIALGRLTRERPLNLPEQTLISWLGVPTLDFREFALQQFGRKRHTHITTANDWQIYNAERSNKNWTPVTEALSERKRICLCRYQPEGIKTYQRGIADFKRMGSEITCQKFVDLSFQESLHVACGMHLISGVFRNASYRADGEYMELLISTYEAPEIHRFLNALSAETLFPSSDQISFYIPILFKPAVISFLHRFGIDLFQRL